MGRHWATATVKETLNGLWGKVIPIGAVDVVSSPMSPQTPSNPGLADSLLIGPDEEVFSWGVLRSFSNLCGCAIVQLAWSDYSR